MSPFYPSGKLPSALLGRLLAQVQARASDPRVLVGPRLGEDAAVLDFGDTCLVLTTDPITFATEEIGWYAVQINANDVAVRGARPCWFMATLLLPEFKTDERLVASIFDQMEAACDSLGCTLIGGHTEITVGLNRPLVIGQMVGEVARERLVTTGGAQEGDALLLTKGIAIEGTAVLAREFAPRLRASGVTEASLARARDYLHDPGISIVNEAMMACQVTRVHAMHDPTEGGLATGLAELAAASGKGVRVDNTSIPRLAESQAIATALGLDLLGTLASGALLLAVAPTDVDKVRRELSSAGILCAEIGRVASPGHGLVLDTPEGAQALPAFSRDQVVLAFDSFALAKGDHVQRPCDSREQA